ncbi:Sugar transporter ERD6-like 16 [Zostera marina]|uniref:Sugar transporter ERD6-like 16 n=1 Tax=Zostera marina TaxID=29655 RepID=A0A0K9PA39_ZOSMR|nr:Sugar transporter ERD6-like 16 [Zostera marina]
MTYTGFELTIYLEMNKVPIFIAEIAPQDLRGSLTTVSQLMICFGSSTAYIVGAIVSWRALVLLGVFPCILLFLGLFFIPESPRWLANDGKQKEFREALQQLRGKGIDISVEASDIQENVDNLENHSNVGFWDIFEKKYYRPIGVGVGLMVFQQLSGCNGIGFYASQIFISAGFSSGDIGTILMGTIQVPITMVGVILMDRCGRRSLLMVSATGTFLGTFIAGLAFYLKEQGLFLDRIPSLVLIGILVYMGFFSIGMGAIPWVIMSEIFPLNIKGIGGSLVTLVNWSGSWVVSYAFIFFLNWSSSGTFFIFSVASGVTVLFVNKFVPETKGRTLEEIQNSFNS